MTVSPLITVTTIDAGVEAAVMGLGLARLLSYQTDALVAAGKLRQVLKAHEADDVPIHIIQPASAHVPTKVRAFIERLAPALRAKFG